MDKNKQVEIIASNTRTLKKLQGYTVTSLSKKAKVDHGTISKLLAGDTLPNPTVKVITGLSSAFGIMPWMLMIENFPFQGIAKLPLLQTMSAEGYSLLKAYEKAPSDTIRYAILDSIAHSLCKIDDKTSNEIKETQIQYLAKNKT